MLHHESAGAALKYSCRFDSHCLTYTVGFIRRERCLDRTEAIHAGAFRGSIFPNGRCKFADHGMIHVRAPISPIRTLPLMPVNTQVLAEGIYNHGAALSDNFQRQAAPGWPVLWSR